MTMRKLVPIALIGSLIVVSLWLLVTGRLDDYCYDLLFDERCYNLELGERNSVTWTDSDGDGHTIFWVRSSTDAPAILPTALPFPVEDIPADFRQDIINTPQEVLDQLPEDIRQNYLERIVSLKKLEQ